MQPQENTKKPLEQFGQDFTAACARRQARSSNRPRRRDSSMYAGVVSPEQKQPRADR
jgi:hypothetical protein